MFSPEKVQFTDSDLAAARALDEIYEALKDTRDFDLLVLTAQISNIREIVRYLMDGDREDLANRLFGLGVMFIRDNIYLDVIGDNDDTE